MQSPSPAFVAFLGALTSALACNGSDSAPQPTGVAGGAGTSANAGQAGTANAGGAHAGAAGSAAAGGAGHPGAGGVGGIGPGGSSQTAGTGGIPASGAGGSVAGAGGTASGGGSGEAGGAGAGGQTYGDPHTGQFNLGPVEWNGGIWNSCAPYPTEIQTVEGDSLAGVGLSFNGEGQLCDACIQITTDAGKSSVMRVVTTGETVGPNDVDLSPAAYNALNSGEYPRDMTWQVVKCPNTGPLYYQFQTGANVWWTSLWIRNQRLPIKTLEVMSTNHPSWAPLSRGTDGTYTDSGGFGEGTFALRATAVDGQSVTDTFKDFAPGDLLTSNGQFQ